MPPGRRVLPGPLPRLGGRPVLRRALTCLESRSGGVLTATDGAARIAAVVVAVLVLVGGASAVAVLRARLAVPHEQAVQGASAAGPGPEAPALPRPGSSGDSTCTDPVRRQQWRVSWKAGDGPMGTVVTASSFAVRSVGPPGEPEDHGGPWHARDGDTWQLRWTPPPQASAPPSDLGTLQVQNDRQGPLPVLAGVPTPVRQSPRFVSPDGACTVYVTPFGDGNAGWPTVAVLGDSLVTQLGPEGPPADRPGPVQTRLHERSMRVEVSGQGGRRWTGVPGAAGGLVAADMVMLDEIRGLRGATAHVVALGVNDAGWVALAPDRAQFGLRLAWVQMQLEPVLDEIRESGQCTVLVTGAGRSVRYLGADEAEYSEAANRINDVLRRAASQDSADAVHVWDWASISADHHTGSLQPWFGGDTVHLNAAGRAAYGDGLAGAAALC